MRAFYILLFVIFYSSNSLAKPSVIYGGFSFGSILPENSLTRFIHDRSKGQSNIKSKIVSQLELNIPTFTKDNLPKDLLSIEPVKPGSRNL